MGIAPFIGSPGPALSSPTAVWDAQAIVGLTDGQAISSWTDSSGNGHTLVPGTGGTGVPRYYSSTTGNLINGHPTVTINPTGLPAMGSSAALALSQPFTVAVVLKSLTTDSSTSYYVFDSAGGVLMNNAASAYQVYAGTVVGTGKSLDLNPHSFICVFNGASSSVTYDGTTGSSINPGANNMSGTFTVGSNAPNAGNFNFNGCFGEVRIYPAALSAGQISAVHSALSSKWGTP